MSAVSLRLPESLHRRVREMALKEGVSMNHLITTALVEKMSALRAVEYLQERAQRATRSAFDAVLKKIADRPVEVFDELPATGRANKKRFASSRPET